MLTIYGVSIILCFNMYSTTSKQQEGCMFKDSHPKCFITTNFDKFPREVKGQFEWSL